MFEELKNKITKCVKNFEGNVVIEFEDADDLVFESTEDKRYTVVGGTSHLAGALFKRVDVEEYRVVISASGRTIYSALKIYTDKGFCHVDVKEEITRKKVCA